MKALLATLLLSATSAVFAQQQQQPQPPSGEIPKEVPVPPLITIDVLMVSVPEAKAIQLLPALKNPQTVDSAEKTLLEMIAKKEATLLDWPHVTTPHGNRAVSESITEERYPIEFEPAPNPPPKPAPAADEKADPNAKPETLVDSGYAVPTTFETRNTGATLEVEPVLSPDEKSVHLQIAPQYVRLIRTKEIPAGVNPKGEKETIGQPVFQTRKTSTSLAMRDGQRLMIFFGKPIESGGMADIFIVGVKILRSDK